jgi:hypothetical protein
MNDSPSRGHRPRRPWPRPAAALAALALTALLATACGSGSSPAASATAGPTRQQAALAYAKCMRAHGVPDFPDPDSNGDFHLSKNQHGRGSTGGGSSSASNQETAANQLCHHLLAAGPQMTAAQNQHALSQLVKYAQCMRAHGVPNFPDPHTTNGGIGTPSGIAFDMSGINQASPQYHAADHACRSLAAHAKG